MYFLFSTKIAEHGKVVLDLNIFLGFKTLSQYNTIIHGGDPLMMDPITIGKL